MLAASLRRATPLHVNTRRGIGQQLCTAFTSVAAPALALDPAFPRVDEGSDKGSILTAKPLEWIRIKRQLDADESLQELADPNLRDSPGQRLSKVLRLEDAIRAMGPMLATADGRSLAAAALASPAFETKAIKKAFNAYSDNVYYEKGDSDRAEPLPAGRYTTKLEADDPVHACFCVKIRFRGAPTPSTRRFHTGIEPRLDQVQLLRDELDYLKKNPAETSEDVVAAQRQAVKATTALRARAGRRRQGGARDRRPGGPGTRERAT